MQGVMTLSWTGQRLIRKYKSYTDFTQDACWDAFDLHDDLFKENIIVIAQILQFLK